MRGYYEEDKGALLETKMKDLGLKEITGLVPKELESLFVPVGSTIKFYRNESNREDWFLIEDIIQFWEDKRRRDDSYERAKFYTLGSAFSYSREELLLLQFYKEKSEGLVEKLCN